MTSSKYVYYFGDGQAEGKAEMKNLLGGKGANLAEMTNLGIPVPPGFTITTETCIHFLANDEEFPEGVKQQVMDNLARVERSMGKTFGDENDPLLVSCRSGARASMPGMMDTVLNIGLTERTLVGMAEKTGNRRFVLDCYRRLIHMYGNVVMGVDGEHFEEILTKLKERVGVEVDNELNEEHLIELISRYKACVNKQANQPFPDDPKEQLWGSIRAVFSSWNVPRAVTYRRLNRLPDDWGTAVNVQTMVFGNMGDDCATGVAFTRDPATGEKVFFGEFLVNAQGEDVVAGIRTPQPINNAQKRDDSLRSLEEEMPEVYNELCDTYHQLENHYKEMQDLEFTIQNEKLYLLQTRTGKRTGFAAVRIAVDMVEEGLIDQREALLRMDPEQLVQFLAPVFEPTAKIEAVEQGRLLARGLNAGPGAACGQAAFTAERAVEMVEKEGKKVILVRMETSPEDIAGMSAAEGILTAKGGMTSHAAVVARGMGKSCVAGCGALAVDHKSKSFTVGDNVVREGDYISIDGTTGEVLLGELPTRPSEVIQVLAEKSLDAADSQVFQRFDKLMSWADEVRRMKVRTNADTPHDSEVARAFGAQGIGLTRTEHMFFGEDRIRAMREMIVADTIDDRLRALDKLLPIQREDFVGILRAMHDLPVTIRLLDPPLHEFLPHEKKAQEEIAAELGVSPSKIAERVSKLSESNPMLGHRGCRLGITYPEIYQMQVRAIMEAACYLVKEEKIDVFPEIMIPLTGAATEFNILKAQAEEVVQQVFKETGVESPYLIGTMIEIPRACLTADQVAIEAEFFSFGTNDLTQMAFGYSRDDAGVFLPEYVEKKVLPDDPFQTLDIDGVGQLVEMGVKKGRATRPDLKVGICGEHGGDPRSVYFCHKTGLDYVSCSPYRVPVARLAAAIATLND